MTSIPTTQQQQQQPQPQPLSREEQLRIWQEKKKKQNNHRGSGGRPKVVVVAAVSIIGATTTHGREETNRNSIPVFEKGTISSRLKKRTPHENRRPSSSGESSSSRTPLNNASSTEKQSSSIRLLLPSGSSTSNRSSKKKKPLLPRLHSSSSSSYERKIKMPTKNRSSYSSTSSRQKKKNNNSFVCGEGTILALQEHREGELMSPLSCCCISSNNNSLFSSSPHSVQENLDERFHSPSVLQDDLDTNLSSSSSSSSSSSLQRDTEPLEKRSIEKLPPPQFSTNASMERRLITSSSLSGSSSSSSSDPIDDENSQPWNGNLELQDGGGSMDRGRLSVSDDEGDDIISGSEFNQCSFTDRVESQVSLLSLAESLDVSEIEEKTSPLQEKISADVQEESPGEDSLFDWRNFLSPDLPSQSTHKRRAGVQKGLMLPTPPQIETSTSTSTQGSNEDHSETEKEEDLSESANAHVADRSGGTSPFCKDQDRKTTNDSNAMDTPKDTRSEMDGNAIQNNSDVKTDVSFDWRDALSPDTPTYQDVVKRRGGASMLILPRPSPLDDSNTDHRASPNGNNGLAFVVDRRRQKRSTGLVVGSEVDENFSSIQDSSPGQSLISRCKEGKPILSPRDTNAENCQKISTSDEDWVNEGKYNDPQSPRKIESNTHSPLETQPSDRMESLILRPMDSPCSEDDDSIRSGLEDDFERDSRQKALSHGTLEDRDRGSSFPEGFVSTRKASRGSYESASEDEDSLEDEESSCVNDFIARFEEKTVLEAIFEEPPLVVENILNKNCGCSNSKETLQINELRWRVKSLLIEKQKLEDRLYSMRKGYDNRVTPFRDTFEAVRNLVQPVQTCWIVILVSKHSSLLSIDEKSPS